MLPSKKFRTQAQQAAYEKTWFARYRRAATRNSLVYVGIPVFATMFAGTYFLTEFAKVRHEQHDRKQTEVSETEKLALSGRRRQININDEYYRLQQLDIDNWEQKRVKRLPGESSNVW